MVTRLLHVAPDGANGYKAEEVTQGTEQQTRVAVGTIRSLFGATDAAGIPDSVTMQMADILSSKIDFLRDLPRATSSAWCTRSAPTKAAMRRRPRAGAGIHQRRQDL